MKTGFRRTLFILYILLLVTGFLFQTVNHSTDFFSFPTTTDLKYKEIGKPKMWKKLTLLSNNFIRLERQTCPSQRLPLVPNFQCGEIQWKIQEKHHHWLHFSQIIMGISAVSKWHSDIGPNHGIHSANKWSHGGLRTSRNARESIQWFQWNSNWNLQAQHQDGKVFSWQSNLLCFNLC